MDKEKRNSFEETQTERVRNRMREKGRKTATFSTISNFMQKVFVSNGSFVSVTSDVYGTM